MAEGLVEGLILDLFCFCLFYFNTGRYSRSLFYKQIHNYKITSFLVTEYCNSAAPNNGIYKFQHNKYFSGN